MAQGIVTTSIYGNNSTFSLLSESLNEVNSKHPVFIAKGTNSRKVILICIFHLTYMTKRVIY